MVVQAIDNWRGRYKYTAVTAGSRHYRGERKGGGRRARRGEGGEGGGGGGGGGGGEGTDFSRQKAW